LRDRHIPNVNVVNQTFDRAKAIVSDIDTELGWRAREIKSLSQVLVESDVVFTATELSYTI